MNPHPLPDPHDEGPLIDEQSAVRASLRELESGKAKDETSSTLFEEEFAAKHGIRFRSDPPDSLQFEYAKGKVIVRNMLAGGGGGAGGRTPPTASPIDEKQENENPFAIKVEVASKAINGDWATAQLVVLSGLYSTHGGTAYNANGVSFPDEAHSELITKGVNGEYKSYVYLYVPLELDNTTGVPVSNSPNKFKAVTGGEIRLRSSPAVVWPQIVKAGSGVATAILIGSWGVQRVNVSGGVPSYKIRVQIDQKVTDNIVLGGPSDNSEHVLPAGSADGDLFFWDATTEKWVTLPAPPTSGKWAVAVKDGVMQWLPGVDC